MGQGTPASVVHYFDQWHISKGVVKKMLDAGKKKGCEKILQWITGVKNHIYWCLTSTKQGFEQLILAKWTSFMRHVSNKHEDHLSHIVEDLYMSLYAFHLGQIISTVLG